MKTKTIQKTLAVIMLCLMCLSMFASCGQKNEASSSTSAGIVVDSNDSEGAKTVKELYLKVSKDTDDLNAMGDAIVEADMLPFATGWFAVEAGGYLNGFSEEISGFNQGICFGPLIGTIPFMGYIFETDDPQALLDTLNSKAMLDWNICTQADEIVCGIDGNRVLFAMTESSYS